MADEYVPQITVDNKASQHGTWIMPNEPILDPKLTCNVQASWVYNNPPFPPLCLNQHTNKFFRHLFRNIPPTLKPLFDSQAPA